MGDSDSDGDSDGDSDSDEIVMEMRIRGYSAIFRHGSVRLLSVVGVLVLKATKG